LFLKVICNAAGQAAGCRRQNEREKSKTSPNLRGGLPQFSRLGSLREQYFKRPEPGIDGGVDLISVALPFGRLWYGEPNAVYNAIEYAKHRSRSFRAVIRVYDETGNVIETHALLENSRSTKRRLSR
jgi:hypothetical protein